MARRVVPKEPVPKAPSISSGRQRNSVRIVVPPTLKTRRSWNWKRLGRWPWLRMIVVVAAMVSVYILLTSGAFAIREVQAVGDPNLPISQMEQRCMCLGGNIFTLQPDIVRRRLAGIPMLVVDDVYGRLPNRLIVEAHYKQPDTIWRAQNGYFLVDARGEVIAPATGPSRLPVVTLKKGQRLALGQHVDTAGVVTVHDLIRYLPHSLRNKISAFYYSPTSGITIYTKRQWYATFGSLSGSLLQARIIIFQWMLTQRGKAHVPLFNYADLQYSNPYVRKDAAWPWDKIWIR